MTSAAAPRPRGGAVQPRHNANRYALFLIVLVLSELTPALPHSTTPNAAWWSASAATVAAMGLLAGVGDRLPRRHWLNTLWPLLLFPAVYALRCADGNANSGFTPLIFLPVIWFALSGRFRDVVLAVVGGALTAFLPLIVVGAPQFPASGWRGLALIVIITATLGPLIFRLVESTTRANRALVRSENEFRAAFENAPLGMAITGLRGDERYRFVRVNRALCELFGRTAAELTSAPVAAFTYPDDVELTEQAFDRATEPDTVPRIEKRYLHKSGRPIWTMVTYSIVYGEDGEPSHLISQIEDISKRRESDQALLEAYEADRVATERVARFERVRSEMASTISHELRTPLTSAAGYVELLVEGDAGPLTEEQLGMLATVSRSLTRLDGIVGDVLAMANTHNGSTLPARTHSDIGEVITSAVTSVTLQAAARGQDLVVSNAVDGVQVTGESGRLERMLVNLLTNALKFTPEDGTITLTATADPKQVRIAVADTGVGIAAEDQKRIFERFYRTDGAVESSTVGTGLGLSIVQAIVNQYGGSIAVDSELGAGSTFTVTLPVKSVP